MNQTDPFYAMLLVVNPAKRVAFECPVLMVPRDETYRAPEGLTEEEKDRLRFHRWRDLRSSDSL
jgi:hypothetical protein